MRRSRAIRRWIWGLLALGGAHAFAQTGPTVPRFIMSKAPPQFGGEVIYAGLRAVVELDVDDTGKVLDVRILKSSGSKDFDERVQMYYKKWRLMPALDEHGTPIPRKLRTAHSLRGVGVAEDQDKVTRNSTPAEDGLPPEAPADPRAFDEPGRVLRMRCKDFLWEYDFLRDVAGANAPLQLDLMPQTALLEAAKRARISPDEYQKLKKNLTRVLREAAKTCREKPDDAFIESVLVPVVSSQLKR